LIILIIKLIDLIINHEILYNAPWYKTDMWPYIVQISWLVFDTELGCIVDDKDRIVNISPNIEISKESIEKHGITREISLASEYTINDVLRDFGHAINQCDIIVAHNIHFDKNVIMCEYERTGMINFMERYRGIKFCTMKKSIEVCKLKKIGKNGKPYYKWPTLESHKFAQFSCRYICMFSLFL